MSVNLTERLSEDLAAIARDAEELFRGKDDHAAARAREIRQRLAEALETTDKTIHTLNGGPSAMQAVDGMIREKPYHALGLVLGIGIVLGLLLKRK